MTSTTVQTNRLRLRKAICNVRVERWRLNGTVPTVLINNPNDMSGSELVQLQVQANVHVVHHVYLERVVIHSFYDDHFQLTCDTFLQVFACRLR